MQEQDSELGNGDSGTTEFVNPADAIGGTPNGTGSDSGGQFRDSAGNEFDPRIHTSPDSRNRDGTFRRKRGRRSGPTQNKAKVHSSVKESAEMLSRCLMISHAAIAGMTKTPELALDESEADALSESSLTLLALYDIRPDPKVEAAINFAVVVGMTYGTRVIAIRNRKRQEKAEKKPGTAGMYDSNGTPVGTTTFTAQEWPIEPEGGNIGSIN